MRTTEELLKLLLDQVENCPYNQFYGMCGEVVAMVDNTYESHLNRNAITIDESGLLKDYIYENSQGRTTYDYW